MPRTHYVVSASVLLCTVLAGWYVMGPAGRPVRAEEAAPIGNSGQDWHWIVQPTPDLDIDNLTLGEFLAWVARESGRKLVLVDDEARKQAATMRVHGSVHGLTPLQALSAVMTTTDLRYDLPDGKIRVSSAGEKARPRG